MKKTFRQFEPETADFVVHHGRYMALRGRNPSVTFMGVKNPREALNMALYAIGGCAYGSRPNNKHIYVVLPMGWIAKPGDPCSKDVDALLKASNGEDPGYYDNSTFYRVDPQYAGQILAVYYVDWTLDVLCGDGIKSAFLPDGKEIKVVAEQPLAYDRWGKQFTPRRLSLFGFG